MTLSFVSSCLPQSAFDFTLVANQHRAIIQLTRLPITVRCPSTFLSISPLNHSAQLQLQARVRVPNPQDVVVLHHSNRPAGVAGHRLPSPGSKVTPGIAQARLRVQRLSLLPRQCSPTHQETGWLRSRRPTGLHHRQIRLESSRSCCR